MVSSEQYERTKQLVEEFSQKGGQGEMLQQKLREFADNSECWVSGWVSEWVDG